MTTHLIGDTATLAGRSLKHVLRSPDTIITTVITPIAMLLLFVYVLGGAISTGDYSGSYVSYLLPGVLLITIASGISTRHSDCSRTCSRASSNASSRCPWLARPCCGRTC